MFTEIINGIELVFETANTSFSPLGVDKGTLAMLSIVDLSPSDKLLDLGCGYGVVGIYAAKLIGEQNVVMLDNDPDYVNYAKKNAGLNGVAGISVILSNGFDDLHETDFSMILCNPPYHTDFSVPKHFIEKGFNRLMTGGKMYVVTKRKDWYKNKLSAIFGGVKLNVINDYYVFCSEKRSAQYANMQKKK